MMVVDFATADLLCMRLCAERPTRSVTRALQSRGRSFHIVQSITLKGTVTKVDWVNPHVYVYLDVKDDKGAVTKWAVTTLPPGNLRRGGLTRDLLGYGETVSILAFRARDGANLAFLRTITFADGHKLEIWLGDASKEN